MRILNWLQATLHFDAQCLVLFGSLFLGASVPSFATSIPLDESWRFERDDFVVVLVESPDLPPEHMLQAQVSVWAARSPVSVEAPLEFSIVANSVPAFRWSTAGFQTPVGNPQPRSPERPLTYPPPPGFYGENGHLPPGVYFLSYARPQRNSDGGVRSHRIGLSDIPCQGQNGDCRKDICVPSFPTGTCDNNAEIRSAIQFHELFRNAEASLSSSEVPAPREDPSKELSKGCLTTTGALLAKIFPEGITDPESSPFRWNGTKHASHAEEDGELGAQFRGSGRALIFVVESLSPGALDQAMNLTHRLRWGQLTQKHFEAGPELDTLRAEWWRLGRDRAIAFDVAATDYARALGKTSGELLGLSDRELPWVQLGYPSTIRPSALAAVDFPQLMDRGPASLRAFEAKAQFRLAQGLAATELNRSQIAARLAGIDPTRPGPLDAETLSEVAIALRESDAAAPLPDLPVAIEKVAALSSSLREARRLVYQTVEGIEEVEIGNRSMLDELEDFRAGVALVSTQVESTGQQAGPAADAFKDLAELSDKAIEIKKAASAVDRLFSGNASSAEVLDLVKLAPPEVREPAEKIAKAYSGFTALQALQDKRDLTASNIEAIGTGVGAVAEACGMNNKDLQTLTTVLNVGLSLASGNYVGAAMSLIGGASSAPDPNVAQFNQINAKLDALLEGQRKILKSLEEVKASIRALEERVVRQHWELLSRLSDLESEIIRTKKLLISQAVTPLKRCESFLHFVRAGMPHSELIATDAWRADWDACYGKLTEWGPSERQPPHEVLRLAVAATDTSQAGERITTRFLKGIANPVLASLNRLEDEEKRGMISRAAMMSGNEEAVGDPQFVDSMKVALSVDGLLAPDKVLLHSQNAQDLSRFWLSVPCAEPRCSTDVELERALRFLSDSAALLNETIAQQVLLSGAELFSGGSLAPEAPLPVTLEEVQAILNEMEVFQGARKNLCRTIISRAARASGFDLGNVFVNQLSDPNWIATAEGREMASVTFESADLPPKPVGIRFATQASEKDSSREFLVVVEAIEPNMRKELGRFTMASVRDAENGSTPSVEVLVEARRELVKLLALSKMPRASRLSFLTVSGIQTDPLAEVSR